MARLVIQEFRLAARVFPLQILESRDVTQTPPYGFALAHPSSVTSAAQGRDVLHARHVCPLRVRRSDELDRRFDRAGM